MAYVPHNRQNLKFWYKFSPYNGRLLSAIFKTNFGIPELQVRTFVPIFTSAV